MTMEDVPKAEQAPGDFHATGVFVADDGSVWVEGLRVQGGAVMDNGFDAKRRVILREGPPLPGTPIDWDSIAAGVVEAHLAAYNAQGGWSMEDGFGDVRAPEYCTPAFVRVTDTLTTARSDSDLSNVRVITKGRKDLTDTHWVEARIGDVHVLGALVPSLAVGKKLLGLLKGHVPSAGVRLYCGRPHVVRAIPMGIGDQ